MRTTQYNSVYLRIFLHQGVDSFLHEIVCSGCSRFVSLDDGSPQRAGHSAHFDIGKELSYFKIIAFAANGSFCGEDSDVPTRREMTD